MHKKPLRSGPIARVHPKTGEPLRPLGVVGGRLVWPIMGASDDDPDDGDDGDGDERTFTQKEVSRIMATEKRQGRAAGERSVLEKLGFQSVDEAEAFVARQREAEKERETEEQRRLREIEERERAAQERDRQAAERERRAEIRGALRDAGVSRDDLDDAYVLLEARLGNEFDEDTLADEIETLQERRPSLFGQDDDGTTRERVVTRPPRGGNLPGGRPRERNQPPKARWGAGGIEEARRRGFIKD